jgi:hypothetical protein
MNGLLLAEYSIFLPEWEGSETELRGCAARCAEAAMPFRKPLDFYRGYAPQVWQAERVSPLRAAPPLRLNNQLLRRADRYAKL